MSDPTGGEVFKAYFSEEPQVVAQEAEDETIPVEEVAEFKEVKSDD